MQYTATYNSPLGKILLTADGLGLTGLWFVRAGQDVPDLDGWYGDTEPFTLGEARRWLDLYFDRREPDFMPPLHLMGTAFQKEVWDILLAIPYGKTTTYGAIAGEIARRRGLPRMSAQAVGGAVGRNPVSLLVPCHRVVGKNGSLTGYAGGIDKKRTLLKLEGGYEDGFFVPKHATAP